MDLKAYQDETKRVEIKDRFFRFVHKDPTGCWFWLGAKVSKKGYGVFKVNGKNVLAHRFSFELHKGPIPLKHEIRHTCDHPPCVNPEHILSGTSQDNHNDAVDRGRLRELECKRGHPFSPSNTYIFRGRRRCKACVRERRKLKTMKDLR